MNKLQKILDKKKTLENLFFYMIRNFFPNIKLVDNSLPDPSLQSSIQANNKEMGKTIKLLDLIMSLKRLALITKFKFISIYFNTNIILHFEKFF